MHNVARTNFCPQSQQPHVSRSLHIESIFEQGSGLRNEDALLCQEPLFAVFDGASSLCGKTYDGMSGAWWAAHIAHATFADPENHGRSLKDMALMANTTLAVTMRQHAVEVEDLLQVWSTSMAAFRLHNDSMEFVQIGDSLLLCITENGFFLPAPYVNHDRETLCKWKELSDRGVQDVRGALNKHICAVRQRMNNTYGALNGTPQARGFLQTGTIPLQGVRQILAFTDGLQLPNATPEQDDTFRTLAEVVRTNGIHTLHSKIRETEQMDPHCHIFPRFKKHDDIAAVCVTL